MSLTNDGRSSLLSKIQSDWTKVRVRGTIQVVPSGGSASALTQDFQLAALAFPQAPTINASTGVVGYTSNVVFTIDLPSLWSVPNYYVANASVISLDLLAEDGTTVFLSKAFPNGPYLFSGNGTFTVTGVSLTLTSS